MRYLPCLLVLLGLPTLASARPPQFDRLDRAAQFRLSLIEIKSRISQAKHEALRFAVDAPVMADTASGSWDEPESGIARWRLRVASSGARSLSFELRHLQLPADAELWIYDRDGHDVQGPITTSTTGSLWTPLVRGEEAVIEATMPASAREQFSVLVAEAFHAYRELSPRSFSYDAGTDTGNDASGICNVDVACSTGDAWRPQIRSTVLLTIGGTTLCSGTLINNALQDDRALILTANHCGVTDANIGSTIAYFNVERSSCDSGSFGSVTQNIRGKSLLSSTRANTDTDFALFELVNKPPSSYKVYYSGFDIGGAVPTSGVGIHHPSGDDKKISRYTTPATAEPEVCIGTRCGPLLSTGFEISAWAVVWSRGTTEGGSSGSGLWNQNGALIGTLSGGTGQCTSATTNNGEADYYARLDVAWTQSGSNAFGTSLKAILDPQNSGCTSFTGKEPGTASALNCLSGTGSSTTPTQQTNSSGSTDASDSGGGGGSAAFLLPVLLLIGRGRKKIPS